MLIANKTENSVQISVIGEIMGENDWVASDAAYMRVILDSAEGAPLSVWVSSPGGSLDAAMAMRAMLEAYQGEIEIHTAGIVASAATLLLCVPQAHVVAERGSAFMIHQSAGGARGNASEMRKAAEALDVCDDEIVSVYKLRLKCGEDDIRDMMQAETWLRASDAADLGLVDELADRTSGGYVAEPRNPDARPNPDQAQEIREAVSACLSPRIEAIQAGLSSITSSGEGRVKAIQNAADAAVNGIVDASSKTVSDITAAGESMRRDISGQLQALRDEIAECRRSYNKQAEKYAALDEALSRVYALNSGDTSFTLHDGQFNRAKPFKLNI